MCPDISGCKSTARGAAGRRGRGVGSINEIAEGDSLEGRKPCEDLNGRSRFPARPTCPPLEGRKAQRVARGAVPREHKTLCSSLRVCRKGRTCEGCLWRGLGVQGGGEGLGWGHKQPERTHNAALCDVRPVLAGFSRTAFRCALKRLGTAGEINGATFGGTRESAGQMGKGGNTVTAVLGFVLASGEQGVVGLFSAAISKDRHGCFRLRGHWQVVTWGRGETFCSRRVKGRL